MQKYLKGQKIFSARNNMVPQDYSISYSFAFFSDGITYEECM